MEFTRNFIPSRRSIQFYSKPIISRTTSWRAEFQLLLKIFNLEKAVNEINGSPVVFLQFSGLRRLEIHNYYQYKYFMECRNFLRDSRRWDILGNSLHLKWNWLDKLLQLVTETRRKLSRETHLSEHKWTCQKHPCTWINTFFFLRCLFVYIFISKLNEVFLQ